MGALALLSPQRVRGHLWQELSSPVPTFVDDLAGEVLPSVTASERYVGISSVPGLREWAGKRLAQTMSTKPFDIANKRYEDTLLVLEDDLRRDKFGFIRRRIADLRGRYNEHWIDLATAAIVAGTSGTGYDGIAFFSASHTEGKSGTQSNSLTQAAATGTTPTNQEFIDSMIQALTQFAKYKDDQGRPIYAQSTSYTLLVPPDLLGQANAALNAVLVASGSVMTTNVLTVLGGYEFRIAMNPFLTATDTYYIFRNNGRSLIRQEEVGLEIEEMSYGSPLYFEERAHVFGISCVRGLGYGDWKNIIKMTFT